MFEYILQNKIRHPTIIHKCCFQYCVCITTAIEMIMFFSKLLKFQCRWYLSLSSFWIKITLFFLVLFFAVAIADKRKTTQTNKNKQENNIQKNKQTNKQNKKTKKQKIKQKQNTRPSKTKQTPQTIRLYDQFLSLIDISQIGRSNRYLQRTFYRLVTGCSLTRCGHELVKTPHYLSDIILSCKCFPNAVQCHLSRYCK